MGACVRPVTAGIIPFGSSILQSVSGAAHPVMRQLEQVCACSGSHPTARECPCDITSSCNWQQPRALTLQLLVCAPHCPHQLLFGFLSSHRSDTVERSLRKRAGDAEVALAAAEQQVAQAASSLALARPLSFFRFEV
jgi:hypothetical protein